MDDLNFLFSFNFFGLILLEGDMPKILNRASILFALAVVGLQGCGSDNPGTPDNQSCKIEVTILPNTLNAPWVLSSPAGGFYFAGEGNLVFSDLQPGTYTMAWEELEGWVNPDPLIISQSVSAGETATMVGEYQQFSTIFVDPSPDSIQPVFWLYGPRDLEITGAGNSTINFAWPGEYTITWEPFLGYFSPEDETLTVAQGDTITFSGTYVFNPDLQFSSSPEILMQNLERVIGEMRQDDLPSLLHENYKTILHSTTLQEREQAGNPIGANSFSRTEEISIHNNIFSGQPGRDAHNRPVPSVESVDVYSLYQNSSWEPIPESNEYFGGEDGFLAQFIVNIYFNNPDQHRFQINHDVEFYVTQVDAGGQSKWMLLGQRGLAPLAGLSTESVLWDALKSMYR